MQITSIKLFIISIALVFTAGMVFAQDGEFEIKEYKVPKGSHPHDVAPAPDGTVWYTAQGLEALGKLDPQTKKTQHIHLGNGSSPHGVIVGPDGAPWITDSGLNAIVRVDPVTLRVEVFPLPDGSGYTNLNTAAFDGKGNLWFTGQSGIYGSLTLSTGEVKVYKSPKGRGPYGIATTPDGSIYYASLAGNYVGHVNINNGSVLVLEPPTRGQGARRVWSDSKGIIWVSEWNGARLASYNPDGGKWNEWRLPGRNPRPYAVWVDENDKVWLSDFGANTLVKFDPVTEKFKSFKLPSGGAKVRQILGRKGEVWGAESGVDKLVVIRQK